MSTRTTPTSDSSICGCGNRWSEAGETCLSYEGNLRDDDVIVAGKKTLRELTEYRDDIAHWWTDTIDEKFLADLRRTINELIRRRYF